MIKSVFFNKADHASVISGEKTTLTVDKGRYKQCPYELGTTIGLKEIYWAFGRWDYIYSEAYDRDQWKFTDQTHEYGYEYRFTPGHPKGRRGGMNPAWSKRMPSDMPPDAIRRFLVITNVRSIYDDADQTIGWTVTFRMIEEGAA